MRALLIFALLVKQGRIKKKRRFLRRISESDYDREVKLAENCEKKCTWGGTQKPLESFRTLKACKHAAPFSRIFSARGDNFHIQTE